MYLKYFFECFNNNNVYDISFFKKIFKIKKNREKIINIFIKIYYIYVDFNKYLNKLKLNNIKFYDVLEFIDILQNLNYGFMNKNINQKIIDILKDIGLDFEKGIAFNDLDKIKIRKIIQNKFIFDYLDLKTRCENNQYIILFFLSLHKFFNELFESIILILIKKYSFDGLDIIEKINIDNINLNNSIKLIFNKFFIKRDIKYNNLYLSYINLSISDAYFIFNKLVNNIYIFEFNNE